MGLYRGSNVQILPGPGYIQTKSPDAGPRRNLGAWNSGVKVLSPILCVLYLHAQAPM